MINIAVIGAGHWGPNLIRNMATLPDARVIAICDLNVELAQKVAGKFCPDARITTDIRTIYDDPSVDAIVLATPVVTHFELGMQALNAGKHLLVEKPLAQTVSECEQLIEAAERKSLVLMTGHTFKYNSIVKDISRRISEGELGDVRYIHGQRVNLGRIQRDSNALWSFAPHDISIFNLWLNKEPVGVSADGFSCLTPGVQDVVFLTLEYPGNVGVNLSLSWLNPQKIRQLTVIGSKKMAVFDDVSLDSKLAIHDKGVFDPAQESAVYKDYAGFQLAIRHGDIHIPQIKYAEPLGAECQEFVDSINEGRKPQSDGHSGLRVTKVLEAAQVSLERGNGHWVEL